MRGQSKIPKELQGIETPPAALAIGMNAFGDFMAVVVVLRQSSIVPATIGLLLRAPS